MAAGAGPANFPHVFEPLRIGGITVPNRLFISAHNTELVQRDPDGYHRWSVLGDRAVAYNAERARGGFGMVMVGQAQVHPQSGTDRPAAFHEQARPHLARMAEECHQHGTAVIVQLNQNGHERGNTGPDMWEPMWGPSAMASAASNAHGEMSKAMDLDDIRDVVGAFAQAARNVQDAGVDGVEVHAAHPHLYGEWLTPAYNKRTDAYGGSLENRLRIVVETVAAVRKAVGRSFVVGVRMNGAWTMPGGQTVEEGVEIARRLEATGNLDFINVSGWPGIGSIGSQLGFMMPWAEEIKKAVRTLPVFGIGRIVDPQQAEDAIAAGQADMVGMTRAGIADPELPRKAREGRVDEIRRCVGAGQGCLTRTLAGRAITCTQNPAVGLERSWGIGTLQRTARARSVLVVGGGPAGLEAAAVAARRGHSVTLVERQDDLGGQVRLIGRVQRRREFLDVVRWREGELRRLGVKVETGREMSPDEVRRRAPDVVVVATGSRPRVCGWYPPMPHLDGIPGADTAPLFSTWDVLDGRLDGAAHVVVVDATAYNQSGDVLEYLAEHGVRTDAVAHAPLLAAGIEWNDRADFDAALRGRIGMHLSTVVERLHPDAVELRNLLSGERSRIDGVDAVVLSIGNDVVDSLYDALRGDGIEAHRIGDCVTPRGVEHAIHEGHRLGRKL
ncbi:MAG TPA: FAD-dependent oxidoreductase [Candidatus Dormibacteraeota bacterium]|jgi:2,4-dienoyl-CoA reductase-like NADH-dependent reductase (Old Yellow Enzyme family)/thioredoxin reductase|nr:FAD-dependent oxidoreductase [Candidatus Dormibacteraeota bacterium]